MGICIGKLLAKLEPPTENATAADERHRLDPIKETEIESFTGAVWLREFSYETLAMATGHFSYQNLIGEGGFGQVYKGKIPPTNQVYAIKKLKYQPDGQQESKFQAELRVINSVRHRYLVKLVGFCSDGANRLLVCEFVPNNSLKSHLHGKDRPTLEWSKRIKIAIKSAKGLAYLHDDCKPKIIHRDVKADNILLDEKFEPKVADFGLAKFFPDRGSPTHISSAMKGTPVYADPEYYPSQRVSEKSDVYSFGVVLLELISGRKPIAGSINIVQWAKSFIMQALENGDYTGLVDPKLQNIYQEDEMQRMIHCAFACVFRPSQDRPLMRQIVAVLEGKVPLETIRKASGRRFPFDSYYRPVEYLDLQHQHYGQRATIIHTPTGGIEMFPSYQLMREFSFEEMMKATNSFSKANCIKKTTYYQVYEGTLSNKEKVEIKKLNYTDGQEGKFREEIRTIISVRHRNLVRLVGYCIDGDNRFLVYEFIPNNSLQYHLHGNSRSTIEWPIRMKIARELAKVLKYLHEDCDPRIIHRDVRAENVLLDNEFETKLANFGLAKFFPDDATHVITQARDTSEYMDPQYKNTGVLTEKSDVYSFGVVLLELITGEPPINNLVHRIVPQLKECLIEEYLSFASFLDWKIRYYERIELIRMIACALACVRHRPETRPTISQVLGVLDETISPITIYGTVGLLSKEKSFKMTA